MALTKCKECGAQLSTKAASCPSCGAKQKRTHWFTWLVAGTIAIGAIGASLAPAPPPKPALSPEAAAAQQKREQGASARRLAARAMAATLKQAARDPDSLVIESMSVNDDGTVVCTEYRARNGFGGMNRSHAVAINGKLSLENTGLWNKHCTKPMFDLSGSL